MAPETERCTAQPRPFVSIVLPIRNEAHYIADCLQRLINQDYPVDRFEIIVIDGASEDHTPQIVHEFQAQHPKVQLRLLANPAKTVPPALNLGIRAARGEIIVRFDGHSVPPDDYVSACVDTLLRSGSANVGGLVHAVGDTPFGNAVAVATGHPLGAGGATYRLGGNESDVDTVQMGAFLRTTFEKVGLFDESMVRNQDYELNIRIHKAGERIRFDPAIRFQYTPRGSPLKLWRQYFQYGWWRMETLRRHPNSLRWRQIIPPAFVLALLVLLALSTWSVWPFPTVLTIYIVVTATIAGRISEERASPWGVMLAFMIIHFSFGCGFLLNVLSRGRYPYRAGPPHIPILAKSAKTKV